jgi:inward rectifier potassium channel
MRLPKEDKTPLHRRRPRLVPRHDDGLRLIRVGQKRYFFGDLYVELLSMPWVKLILLIMLLYVLSNIVFATLYYINSAGIENAHHGSYQDAFFFSIQTMATIGYGHMAPISFMVNVLVAIEALWGFCFFAVTTALLFAKFSQPKARVTFSDVAVISNYNGVPHLKLRLANQRLNRIVDAHVELVLLRNEMTQEGFRLRRFYDLKLIRNHVPLMQLTWTVMHPLDDSSPIHGVTQKDLEDMEAEIIVSLIGLDETLAQTIHARHSYVSEEIICNAFFEDVLNRRDDGYLEVNYQLFHSIRRIEDKSPT